MMVLVIVGMIVGLLSGMFGIGGGTVIVPVLVWLGLSQRHAAATFGVVLLARHLNVLLVCGVAAIVVNWHKDCANCGKQD